MISSAIWDKSAQLNFLKTNKIARARRASAICGLWKIYECWFIPNCPRKIMWLLVYNILAKIWLAFPLLRFNVCHRSLFPPTNDNLVTSTKIGQNFDRWILMDKNASARNLFFKNWSLLSFYVFNFSCFSTAVTERNITASKIAVYLGFGWGKRRNCGFIENLVVVLVVKRRRLQVGTLI